jgi:hypothetical protein
VGEGVKVLTVCQGGNSRSVCLAYILKRHKAHDAIAMGLEAASPATQQMLYQWADRIALTDKRFAESIPPEFRHKLRIYDVGPDRWKAHYSRDLRQMFYRLLESQPL